MATTDTRPGFRLPWGGDRDAQATAVATETADETTGPEGVESSGTPEPEQHDSEPGEAATGSGSEAGSADHDAQAAPFGASAYAPARAPVAPATPARKPTKFLADLTRAMLAAAEAERAEIVERFQAEAKTFTEAIHERSGGDAVDLRKGADEDIAGIRDWSKAEIARIREQTEQRIGERKRDLDEELEAHTARVEREIERIRTTVAAYEAQMARFIEDLSAIEDPTRFASMAETMPEPPSLEDVAAGLVSLAPPPVVVPAAMETVAETAETASAAETAPAAETDAVAAATDDQDPWRGVSFGGANVAGEDATVEATAEDGAVETTAEATIEAAADAAGETAESTSATETETVEATAETTEGAAAIDDAPGVETPVEAPDGGDVDPRVTALGLTPDLAAAEAEAFQGASAEDDGSDAGADDVPAMDDETIAARLASLTLPGDQAVEPTRTQVVVTGLASVASISGFKRTLAQLAGVRQVSVASGPDGEFVFSVTHGPAVDLAATVPTISGFAARVVSTGDGVIRVAAHDPENAG